MIELGQPQLILDSYRHFLGAELIERGESEAEDARALFDAPFVVVSHDTSVDPVLNYGNQAALELWETNLENLLRMPSRLTAEPVAREERARMLERTTAQGYIDDYSGIRISTSGRRFFIPKAIVWNLIDENGKSAGQAAMFRDWEFLS